MIIDFPRCWGRGTVNECGATSVWSWCKECNGTGRLVVYAWAR